MPVNSAVSVKKPYTLELKEYDGVPVFCTSDPKAKTDVVTCHLSKSEMKLPLEQIVSSYIPIKYAQAGQGLKNLTIEGNEHKRFNLNEPISALFTEDKKAVVLYLHLSLSDWTRIKEEQRLYMERFNASLEIPAFWNGKYGQIANEIMDKIATECKKANPNTAVLLQLSKDFNELFNKAESEEFPGPMQSPMKGYIAIGLGFALLGVMMFSWWNISKYIIWG